MKRVALAVALLLCAIPSVKLAAQTATSLPQPPPSLRCVADARDRATTAFEQGATRDAARLQLETDAASCLDPSLTPDAARLVGVVNTARAQYSRDFLQGNLSLGMYRAILDDRRDKLERLLRDPDRMREVVERDADGDLVPDGRDRCPGTPYDMPTDANGCPSRVQQRPGDPSEERRLRTTLAGSRILYNRSCDGAPPPRITVPLEWGRGPQTKLGTAGFNIAVAKVSGQAAGCEIFYELEFRFIDPNPGNPALPPSRILTVVFSESEDLLLDTLRIVLPLPVGPTLSAARTALREAMLRQYFRVTWRVRAVNGSNVKSEWSPFVTQGPAPGGVNG